MKCDECLNLLEAYVDGEATRREADLTRAHIGMCATCASELEALTAENEMYARYDRDLRISPSMWNAVAAQIANEPLGANVGDRHGWANWVTRLFAAPSLRFAMPAVAVVVLAMIIGIAYWRSQPLPAAGEAKVNVGPITRGQVPAPDTSQPLSPNAVAAVKPVGGAPLIPKSSRPRTVNPRTKEPDVMFSDAAYSDLDDRDTASHLEQAQSLLLAFREIKSDTDEEIDVSYEKAESRRLLAENILLRRDAENAGKFPAKSMLGSLEPFLIDIANLPDKAKPSDVRQINDRAQRTEIVAELRGY